MEEEKPMGGKWGIGIVGMISDTGFQMLDQSARIPRALRGRQNDRVRMILHVSVGAGLGGDLESEIGHLSFINQRHLENLTFVLAERLAGLDAGVNALVRT